MDHNDHESGTTQYYEDYSACLLFTAPTDRSEFQEYFFQDHAKSPKRLASSAATAMGAA